MAEPIKHVVGLFDEYDVKDGLCINFVRRPLKVIFKEIEAKLDPKTMEWFDYWGVSYPWSAHKQETDARMPAYRWIAIYHVEGGSEGHWVHVAAIIQENEIDEHILLWNAKTLLEKDGPDKCRELIKQLEDIIKP